MPDRAMPPHNIGYWTGVEYLGLGLGASSLVGGKRFQVTADLNRYLVFTKEELAAGAQYEEIHELSRPGADGRIYVSGAAADRRRPDGRV